MGKIDTLSLYRSIMGEMWSEDEANRARSIRDRSADRNRWVKGVGYGKPAKPTAVNIAKVASGSRAAVFKRIRAGGCQNSRSLQNQLDYINDKAAFVTASSVDRVGKNGLLTEGQKSAVIDDWSKKWRGTTKMGFTSHMLLSFPTDTSFEQVRDIASEWCIEMFESGHYGDSWDYVMAVHTDREHPHAHIVLNNRGQDFGTWFSCWRDGVFSPLLMREKQAEIAEKYGVLLDTSTRLERGILEKPAALDEIYAAKAEGRNVQEIALSPQERAIAESTLIGFSDRYKNVADVLKSRDHKQLGWAVEKAAKSLADGNPVRVELKDVNMEEIRTVGDAIDTAEGLVRSAYTVLEEYEGRELVETEKHFERHFAQMAPYVANLQFRTSFAQTAETVFPPGADVIAKDAVALASAVKADEVGEVLDRATEAGLNADDLLARFEAGGSTNLGTIHGWLDRDLDTILSEAETSIEAASDEQYDAALAQVNTLHRDLSDTLSAVLQISNEQQDELMKPHGQMRDGETLTEDTTTGFEIAEIAATLYEGAAVSREEEDQLQDRLTFLLKQELSEADLAKLEAGNHTVLKGIVPNQTAAIEATKEHMLHMAEDRSDFALAQQALKLDSGRELKRDRSSDLDDDMGL